MLKKLNISLIFTKKNDSKCKTTTVLMLKNPDDCYKDQLEKKLAINVTKHIDDNLVISFLLFEN